MVGSIADQIAQYKVSTTKEMFLKCIYQALGSHGGYYLALNPGKILSARHAKEVHQILVEADSLIVDGIGAKWSLERFSADKFERITGVDVMADVLAIANEKKITVGFFGGRRSVIEEVANKMPQQYPDCTFLFFISGYGQGEDEVVSMLGRFQVDLVFVALGSPKQEKWIYKASKMFPDTYFTGVGGGLDVWTGSVKRAPAWVQSIGMEWLYRFVKQPVSRFKSVFRLFVFVVIVFKEKKYDA